jgi:hypothetical protein
VTSTDKAIERKWTKILNDCLSGKKRPHRLKDKRSRPRPNLSRKARMRTG